VGPDHADISFLRPERVTQRSTKSHDSPVEGSGFELSVPLRKQELPGLSVPVAVTAKGPVLAAVAVFVEDLAESPFGA
jgi:hypothetical protein